MHEALKRPIAAAGACGVAIAGLVILAYAVPPLEHLDARILLHFAARNTPRWGPLAQTLSHLGDAFPLALMLAAICAFALIRRQPQRALAAVFVVAGSNIATQLLKLALAHPRLQPVSGAEIGPAAFPSGHATAAMSIAVAAILVAPTSVRPLVALLAGGFAVAVSASLLVLAWHLPSDVAGGWLVAWAFGFLALAGLRAVEADAHTAPASPHQASSAALPAHALNRE